MVQYARHSMASDAYNVHEDYWKLAIYDKQDHKEVVAALTMYGYCFTTSAAADESRLKHLLSRAERGLMSYERRAHEELAAFCQARSLSHTEVDDNKSLISVLEHADEGATFHRFSDLPAELRVRIYGLHFETFEGKLEAPVQPPITRVSKLLRKEALPVFYQRSTLTISIMAIADEYHRRHHKWSCLIGECWITDVAEKPKAFWTQLPEHYLSMITNLHIEDTQYDDETRPKYLIDLSTNDQAASVELLAAGVGDHLFCKVQKKKLQKLVTRMIARPEGKKLQRPDIEEIIRQFDRGVRCWRRRE